MSDHENLPLKAKTEADDIASAIERFDSSIRAGMSNVVDALKEVARELRLNTRPSRPRVGGPR